jgi:hypothetical protein
MIAGYLPLLQPKIPAQADANLRPIAPKFCERLPVFASKVVACRKDVQGLQIADGWCEPIGCEPTVWECAK